MQHGVLRLLMLSLPQQYKFVRQQIASNRELLLLAQGVELSTPLADALAERIFIECFLSASDMLPRSRQAFEKLMNDGRGNLDKVTARVLALVASLFKELRKVRQLMVELQSSAFATALGDVRTQLQYLLPAEFLRSTPSTWFSHLLRYVQALVRRLERLRSNAARDAEVSKQISPFITAYMRLHATHMSAEIEQFKWMIEELRVSLFAQDLRTSIPVSVKRLNEQLVLAQATV
jgi:ATP-dependent helicase HrpA